jgi:hypothetical protein
VPFTYDVHSTSGEIGATMSSLKLLGSYVEGLEKRPDMYIPGFRFDTFVAFLLGFDLGCDDQVLAGFEKWLRNNTGLDYNAHWSNVVRDELASGNEQMAVALLITRLKEYIASCD